MQRGSEFSLAAALFGWPPAPGHAAPDEAIAPDAWVLLFREQHAASDPAVLSGMFTACPAGRDWVREAAPKVTVSLNTTAQDQPYSAWVQRTSVLQCILSARQGPAASGEGTQAAGVCLRVTVDDSAHSAAACSALSTLLCGDSSAVTELYVRHESESDDDPSPQTPLPNPLFSTGAVYPCLTILTLEACPYAAPPPASVPSLRQFTITNGDREHYWNHQLFSRIIHSIGPLTPQLTHLTIYNVEQEFPNWSHVFRPGSRALALTHLHTYDFLDGDLAALLATHAPVLTDLSVFGLSRVGGDSSDRVWGVERLCLENGDDYLNACLVALPRREEGSGPLEIFLELMQLRVETSQEREPELCARFPDIEFKIDALCLDASDDLPPARHPAALSNALRQLEGSRVSKCKPVQLRLHRWQWDTATLRALVTTVPVLAELGIHTNGRLDTDITDEQLGVLISAEVGVLPRPTVYGLALQSDAHAGAAWPWDQLTVYRLCVLQLLRLPWPGGEGAPRKLAGTLHLDASIQMADIPELTRRLQHIQWASMSAHSGVDIHLDAPQPEQASSQAEVLRTQLAVLRAVQFADMQTEQQARLYLPGWHMTRELVTELQGLPHWQCLSSLDRCVWPENNTSAHVMLGRCLPSSYRVWP